MKSKLITRPALLVVTVGGLLLAACGARPLPTRVEPLQPPVASPFTSPTVPAALFNSPPTVQSDPVTPAPATAVTPTAAATPTRASPPSPTPTPVPRLSQLTSGGCCTRAFWSADSRQVQFIDRPASRPVGIYGVDVERPGPSVLVTEWIVNTTGGGAFYVYPDGDTTVVQRAATGAKYAIANGGRPVSVSPDGGHALWQVMEQNGNFDRRRGQIWVAKVDGNDARVVAETVGVSWSEWGSERRVLLAGLPLQDLPYVAIAALTLGREGNDDQLVELAQVVRPRGMLASPGGNWLVYFLTFQPSPSDDGLWLVPTDGSQRPRHLDFFGSYRWRDDSHLLYVLLELDLASHTLWEYDVLSGASRPLTDPTVTSLKIANNDWAVSPDGRYVVFVNAADHNLWLLDLGR